MGDSTSVSWGSYLYETLFPFYLRDVLHSTSIVVHWLRWWVHVIHILCSVFFKYVQNSKRLYVRLSMQVNYFYIKTVTLSCSKIRLVICGYIYQYRGCYKYNIHTSTIWKLTRIFFKLDRQFTSSYLLKRIKARAFLISLLICVFSYFFPVCFFLYMYITWIFLASHSWYVFIPFFLLVYVLPHLILVYVIFSPVNFYFFPSIVYIAILLLLCLFFISLFW